MKKYVCECCGFQCDEIPEWGIGNYYLVPHVIEKLEEKGFVLKGTKEGIFWFKKDKFI